MSKKGFLKGFFEADGSMQLRIARGLFAMAKEMPIILEKGEYFPSAMSRDEDVGYSFGNSVFCNRDHLTDEEYTKIAPFLTGAKVYETRTQTELDADENKLCWGGGWVGHSNPDYSILFHLGTNGMRRRNAIYATLNEGKENFYEALSLTLDALDVLGDRMGELAKARMAESEGEEKKLYARMAEAFENIPRNPARNLYEALLDFWLYYTFDGVDSPGRFDQYMYPFYATADKEDARMLLENLWQLFYKVRAWNLCLSGSDRDWNDQTNELSYLILDIAAKYKYNTPNITLRIHRNTPEALYQKAAEVIATGIGMPALYNDEIVVPALEELGIPRDDAHRYCMNGCNQIDIMGRSHMGLEDGEVSLIKCLELALTGGECLVSGKKFGKATSTIFETYEDVYAAYCEQVEYATDMACDMSNKAQAVYATWAPNSLRSNFIMGCVEKGLDYKDGGPLYNHGQVLTEGLADAADSLAAIRHFVFETRELTMEEMIAAIRSGFAGQEVLRQKLRAYKKFGNDDPEVDEIAHRIYEHFFRYLMTKRTFRGGIYGGGLSTFSRTADYGTHTGANANGRAFRDPLLADSIGAEPGCDKMGPTAALKSAAGYNQTLAKSGLVLNIKFGKELFATEQGVDIFINMVKTYFSCGGQQLSVNVVSLEELLDAKKHPEAHQDLIVRVGGFSAYFCDLEEGLQDNIIERTQFMPA
ncbi:MAG: hypothetical protein IJN58_01320 [Clostridia bacterium]|nr:hypothetical protein [Clostridia bacterium]